MTIALTKDSIDIGIVISDSEKALKFYRDTLDFEHVADIDMPGGGTMHRLLCGTTLVKLVKLAENPDTAAPPGGIAGATGIRYWTISVPSLEDIVATCRDAGYTIVWEPRQVREGVSVAMVEDPDGNWVEFLHTT